MKYFPILVAMALFALAVTPPACKTDAQGNTVPDWAVIDKELDLLAKDLVVAAEKWPEKAERYEKLGASVAEVDLVVEALDRGNVVNVTTAKGAIDAALAALEVFKDEEWAFLAGSTLRRIKAYLPSA